MPIIVACDESVMLLWFAAACTEIHVLSPSVIYGHVLERAVVERKITHIIGEGPPWSLTRTPFSVE